MSQLVETIKVLNGQIYRLTHHNRRLNQSRLELYEGITPLSLEDYIVIPNSHQVGLYKCRVVYNRYIQRVELLPYSKPVIESLRLVHSDNIDYSHKWTNRDKLKELYSQKKNSDDILIIKNGLITDTYYCNVAFKKGDKWYTPQTPLLEGTQRSDLILSGTILTKDILLDDIKQFTHICLFNAMNEFNEIIFDIDQIQR